MVIRVLVLVSAALACVAAWAPHADAGRAGTMLLRAGAPVLAGGVQAASPPVDRDPALARFLAHSTPDDVARGVHALRTSAGAPGLSAAQEAELTGPARAGRDARTARDAHRTRRRAAEEAWLRASAGVVEALPKDARGALARRGAER
jgi:hypothetical protein